jgi:hypothetical protein
MPYTIQFENQPSAQGAASEVRIVNQLPPELDWTSFRLNDISFGGVQIRIPTGLSHYEGRVPYAGWTWSQAQGWHRGQTPLYVDVAAGINSDTGLVSVKLACSDTNTGVLPADAFAGFLPPNRPELAYYETNGCCGAPTNTTLVQPGQGYVSYTIRPKANLVTGTGITNAADIYFDFNDPIATPPIFNTIDAGAPVSTVVSLPSEVGRTFLVQWAGQDDAGGSGVQSYDVYVSSDDTNYTHWLERTSDTAAYFVGERGQTYRFYSVARDWVGHEEPRAAVAQAQTMVMTNAPMLARLSNATISVGQPLELTNMVSGSFVGAPLFSLVSGSASGATVNPTNGVVRWTPYCLQGSTTNVITVWVRDSGNTNILDAMSFTVFVGECVQPQLGQLVLRAGERGRLPINLDSSETLTNLTMVLDAPLERVGDFATEIYAPELCAHSIVQTSNLLHRITLSTCSNQWLIATQGQQVAWLYLSAASNQSSAFLWVTLTNTVAAHPDGTRVTNYLAQSGRIVVVGEQPLLEAIRSTNGQPALVIYAPTGTTNIIESTSDFTWPVDWIEEPALSPVVMTNLFRELSLVNPNRTMFYRAIRR